MHKCVKCQEHGNNFNLLPAELHNLVSPWSFAQWGMNIVGPLLISRSQKKFLLVAIDYFTKWVEVEPWATIIAAQVQKFVWTIIYHFGLPQTIVTDNGQQFIDKQFVDFYSNLRIKHVTSSVEHSQTNR